MNIVYPVCCGIDVHKKNVVATLLVTNIDGTFSEATKTFSTMTSDLLRLKEWLRQNACAYVAMESTGKYWIPVSNILEDSFEVTLANPKFIKNVPGKKTVPNDSRWIAKLHRLGLVPGSFLPPKEIRELRELTRYRQKLVSMRTSEKQRVYNTLTVCNIMIANVASDIFGVSGSSIINSLIEGKELTHDDLSSMVKGKFREKVPELVKALEGKMSQHHVQKLSLSLNHYLTINESIAEVEALIHQKCAPFKAVIDLLLTVPGVNLTAAHAILAEIGPDMSVFHSATHLSSWAGVSPKNNSSAGKKKSKRITSGDAYLKTILCQCAHAAVKKKESYLGVKYNTLKARRGTQKAIIAICRVLLVAIYHMLINNTPYQNVDRETYVSKSAKLTEQALVKKLQALGYNIQKAE
jgi:transposase